MINFHDLCKADPYILFKKRYDEALEAGQKNIEAIAISTYNIEKKEVDSRFVNLKFIDDEKFIFFTNYNSPKSKAFESYNQISGLFYWSSTNVQIRIKAKISKTSSTFNQNYFKQRSHDKNALAISSKQSCNISSYEEVVKNYNSVFRKENLTTCPNYWGGFFFIPYYFEFWKGHESRINSREVFKKIDKDWEMFIIQP